ncbi:hypothetical protein KC315_g7368 [Hortaea werneckii]|nr:hypothetical protein KC315_g7368 [Hortaea werneckii]
MNAPAADSNIQKRDACIDGPGAYNDYDLGIHIAALFVVLATSGGATAFPPLAVKFPQLRIPQWVLFVVRHFGTGVILSTAFVHLLPTAFKNLYNPCMGKFWHKTYPNMPGAITLGAIFLVAMLEMGSHRYIAGSKAHVRSQEEHRQRDEQGFKASGHGSPDAATDESSEKESQSSGRNTSHLQVFLLEAGIIFHSVFIGIGLSVSSGEGFVPYWIAIIFHQAFEGLALGTRIADVGLAQEKWSPWLMSLAYGLTTPLGQAIGIGTHTFYSPKSETGHIVVGVFNALSAGFLIWSALVEIVAIDFMSNESWVTTRGWKRYSACIILFIGAFIMSLLPIWVGGGK